MAVYRTQDGDMVDEICYLHYGRTTGTVEAVYAVNAGLAEYGPVLPAGVLIELPDISIGQSKKKVKLPWS